MKEKQVPSLTDQERQQRFLRLLARIWRRVRRQQSDPGNKKPPASAKK